MPYSNVIKIKRKFENPTLASFKFNSCLWISPNLGGNFAKNEVIFPRDNRVYRFKRSEGLAISGVQPDKGWAFITNVEKKMRLGIITGNTNASTILSLDLGNTMLELFIMSKIQMQPGKKCELEDYAVLTSENHKPLDKLAEILRYQ